jgi:hypothetical protein
MNTSAKPVRDATVALYEHRNDQCTKHRFAHIVDIHLACAGKSCLRMFAPIEIALDEKGCVPTAHMSVEQSGSRSPRDGRQ